MDLGSPFSFCAGAPGEVVPSGESGECLFSGEGLSVLVLNEGWALPTVTRVHGCETGTPSPLGNLGF